MSNPSKHIHILGICGTFMGSLARLAQQLGYQVSGSDQHSYPPMSTQLEALGIQIYDGYDPSNLPKPIDELIIGNALSRGNPLVEYALNQGLPYSSGPDWLSRHLLQDRWVLAVAGTHGKTTTASMLAWILHDAGLKPGYLIGGIPKNLNQSAELGDSDFFVIEADEYDSAFFDKRSKFIHYRPKTLIINNLEFDHADIFEDLNAIQTQCHHLVKILPNQGLIIMPDDEPSLQTVIDRGCWTPIQTYTRGYQTNHKPKGQYTAKLSDPSAHAFQIVHDDTAVEIKWQLTGLHNVSNALSAVLAARHVGIPLETSARALCKFEGVARRMEKIAQTETVSVYDDFAHHPTAIKSTLLGLRHSVGNEIIKVIIEPRSNTMRMGVHQSELIESLVAADQVLWLDKQTTDWNLSRLIEPETSHQAYSNVTTLLDALFTDTHTKQHWLIMSNGGFDGIYDKIRRRLA